MRCHGDLEYQHVMEVVVIEVLLDELGHTYPTFMIMIACLEYHRLTDIDEVVQRGLW
jgi:hypothetical protein